MTVAIYLDHHVPSAITRGLRMRGADLLTTNEDRTADWSDPDLLERATSLGRVLVTFDHDFLKIADDWQSEGREFAGLVFVRKHGLSIGRAIDEVLLITQVCDPQDLRNQLVLVPLS